MTSSDLHPNPPLKLRLKSRATLASLALGATSLCYARGLQPPAQTDAVTQAPRSSKSSTAFDHHRPVQESQAQAAPHSASTSTAVAAKIVFSNGDLLVDANNSDLVQILKKIADLTGMTIDGTVTSARVFGVYGPRSPQAVITDLLAGSGSNFIMVGLTQNGAPRQLVLTPENSTARTLTAAQPAPTPTVAQPPTPNRPEPEQLGPGAVAHVPPPPPEDPQLRMQRNLQRLSKQMQDKPTQQEAPASPTPR